MSKICLKIYTTQHTHKKKTLKNGHRIWIDIFQGRYTDGQRTHEKVFSIAQHEGNANQKHKK